MLDVLKQIPDVLKYECCIVGDGPERQRLIKKCTRYNLDNRVRFMGEINHTEISEIYSKSDVLIFPSFREATGTVILEAMSMGVPVIAMNRFGGAMILDESCGWLYDGKSEDEYCESLKNILIQCLCEPDEVRKRGDNAKYRAEQFTWNNRNQLYLEIYKSLV